jgi:hypothetical protein
MYLKLELRRVFLYFYFSTECWFIGVWRTVSDHVVCDAGDTEFREMRSHQYVVVLIPTLPIQVTFEYEKVGNPNHEREFKTTGNPFWAVSWDYMLLFKSWTLAPRK